MLAALGAALWVGASLLFRPRASGPGDTILAGAGERARRWLAYLLFAAPGAAVAALVIKLDQAQAAPPSYAGAGALGALTLGLVALLLARFPRISSSFQGF